MVGIERISHIASLPAARCLRNAYGMAKRTLTSYLPKKLFFRALLILIMPIISLQLIVGFSFINRHFAGVTDQMTESVVLELNHIIDRARAEGAVPLPDLATDFGMRLRLDPAPMPPQDFRWWTDLSGKVLMRKLRENLRADVAIDLRNDDRAVSLAIDLGQTRLFVDLPRSRVSPTNAHQLLVLMITVSMFLILISMAFLRNQTRPIRRLAEVSTAFGKGQILPIEPAGAEEVRRAIFAFLAMRTRLERQMGQRTAMLSAISHDLRTPLTRLKLALALRDDADAADMQTDLLEMEHMLDEFLAFSRGETADDLQDVDCAILAERLIEQTRRSGVDIEFQIINPAHSPTTATLRQQAVERAVQNLINNAQRYGTRIRLALRILPKAIEFIVEDNGPGISEPNRDTAIRPFVRLDNARNQNKGGGVGLGLSIVSDVARSHGGVLELGVSIEFGGLRAGLRLPR